MAEKINKYEAIAPQILELVGGKDNIRSFAHCMTRLRFNVKDRGLVDADKIGKLPGCMGTQWAGDQLQVIIGQAVDRPMMRSVQQVVCRRKQLWPKIWTAIRRKNSV